MRFSRTAFGLSLAGAVLLTFLATISIARYTRQKPRNAASPTRTSVVVHDGRRPDGRTDADIAFGGIDGVIAAGSMPQCEYSMEGRILHIEAVASMFSKQPGSRFVWSVRVLAVGDSGQVFRSKWYDDQIFEMPESHFLRPTFEDRLDLGVRPGRYYVETAVYEIPKGQGMDILKDPKTLKNYIGPQQGHFVVVPK